MRIISRVVFVQIVVFITFIFLFFRVPYLYAYKADILHYLGEGHGSGSPETDPLNELTQSQYGGYTYDVIKSVDSTGAASKFVVDGKLQYPDGSPRYRVIIFGGGSGKAYYYGRSCSEYTYCGPGLKRTNASGVTGRQKVINFVNSGGGYVGMCAGSFFASRCVNDSGGTSCGDNEGVYSGIWPWYTQGHGASGVQFDHALTSHEINHPVVNGVITHPFGDKISGVWFYGGSSLVAGAPNTSYVAQFSGNASYPSMIGKTAVIVYDTKTSSVKGRVVVSGSHPEIGNHNYWRRMVTYAMGKIPPAKIISSIANGSTLSSSDYYPVGDKQFHYYSIDVPGGSGHDLRIELHDGPISGGNNDLYVRRGDIPTTVSYDYRASTSTSNETMNIPNAPAGKWFLGIYGAHDNFAGEDYTIKALYTVATGPTPTPTPIPTATPGGGKLGDVNGDGKIDLVDMGIIIDVYGIIPIVNTHADLNNDGQVNMVDIGIVIDNYGV